MMKTCFWPARPCVPWPRLAGRACAAVRRRRPRRPLRFRTTSCSPTGPARTTGVPPWDKVKPELFTQAFQFGIDEQRREIDAIANNPAAPTFANTIEAMEKTGQRLDRVENVFAVMTDNMSTPEYQALDKEWSPKLSAAFDKINLNAKLFAARRSRSTSKRDTSASTPSRRAC